MSAQRAGGVMVAALVLGTSSVRSGGSSPLPPTQMFKEKRFFWVILVLVIVIYGQSLWGTFVYDDRGILEHWDLLSKLSNMFRTGLYPYWTVEAGLYRPITLLSYTFNIVLLGGSALSFHLVNIFLYLGISWSIYVFVKRLFGRSYFAILSALIFLVLPIHTEVVANITGRSELLALLFSLLAFMEVVKEKSNFWLVGLYSFLAIGSKESAIALLPLVFILKRDFKIISAAGIGVAFYLFIRFFVLGINHFVGVETSEIDNPLMYVSASERIATALQVLWIYFSKTLVPLGLCSDYLYNQIEVAKEFFNLKTVLGGTILLGSVVSFFAFIRKHSAISLASAVFLTSFLPVSNIFFATGTIAGERLFFFPSLGIALILAYVLSKRKPLIYIAFGLIIIFSIFALQRQSVWLTEEKLFTNAAECAPKSVSAQSNFGTVYYFKGDYKKAQETLEYSRSIKPVYGRGLNNLGLAYWKTGEIDNAIASYHQALIQRVSYPGAIENLVLLYAGEKDYDSANRWFRLFNNPQ